MKKEDMIKYALIAVGAYLLYQWLTQPGGFLDPARSAAALIPGEGAGAGAGTQQTTQQTQNQTTQQSSEQTSGGTSRTDDKGTSTGSRTGTRTPTPDDTMLKIAAYDSSKAGTTGSFKLNAHQWNWYRAARAQELKTFDAAIHQPALDAFGDPNLQYTAAEYHALLGKAGISGLNYGWGLPTGMSGWAN